MAENKNWEIFLRLLCKSREASRESGLYKLIIEHFPIQLMQKLLSTAVDVTSTKSVRKHAAAVMVELNDDNLLEKNYSRIEETQTLDSLRRNALNLTVDYEVGSTLQVCGEQTALKLVRQSLELEERWDVLLDFVEECFTSVTASTADDLDRLLAIFRGLPYYLRDKLVRMMKPRIAGKSEQFEATMMQLLHQARDDAPFLILPSIIHASIDRTISPAIIHAAITTRLFTTNRSAYFALHVAEIYVYCIQHTSLTRQFPFSAKDFSIMATRIHHLVKFLMDYCSEVANRLLRVFVEKFPAYFPED